MRFDQSYGIVPLKQVSGKWMVFLVRHQSGHWTLPKGHPEMQEHDLECAKRELFEETGLSVVRLLSEKQLTERYQFASRGTLIDKTVGYYLAEVTGLEKIQIEEIKEGRWLELEQAKELVTYPQMKSLLDVVSKMLS